MDYIGGVLNPIVKMPKTHYKNEFCNGFTGKKLMVYNGILMESIGISVMVSIGLLFFFSRDLTSFFSTGQTVFQLF